MESNSESNVSLNPLKEPVAPSKSPRDPVIEEMEKFMKETEIVGADALTVSSGKIYDTDNLLQILGSKNANESTCIGCVLPLEKPKMRVLPKRRKAPERSEEPPPKKDKTSKMARRIVTRLRHAREHTIRRETCEKMVFPKRRRATRISYYKNHKGKILLVEIRNDANVKQNNSESGGVKIKREVEVIDLTVVDDQNSYLMLINFGRQRLIEEVCFGTCKALVPTQYRRATVSTVAGETAVTTAPDVRNDPSLQIVDLTLDEEKTPPLAISEKECANIILPIVYQFHEMSQLFQEAEKSFKSGSFNENTKALGYQLVQALSDKFVKNINMSRFLEILASKVEDKYKLLLDVTTVARYLKLMFDENRRYCKNTLTRNFLKEIDNYHTLVKSEILLQTNDFHGVIDSSVVEVFTQDQLKLLVDQIRQYHELAEETVTIITDEDSTNNCVVSWEEEKVAAI